MLPIRSYVERQEPTQDRKICGGLEGETGRKPSVLEGLSATGSGSR